MASNKRNNWSRGANNQSEARRLPEGFARELVNVDPLPGGTLELRTGYRKLTGGDNIRAMFSRGNQLVFVDGDQLRVFDTGTNSPHTLATVAGAGPVAGTVHNDQLYLSTPTDSVRYDGAVKQWAVPEPVVNVTLVPGYLPAGVYKVGVTALGDDAVESGCNSYILTLDGTKAIQVTSADSRPLRLYCSVANGATLFYQGGLQTIVQVDDSRETLTTDGMWAFPAVERLVSCNAMLVGSVGRYVYVSDPFHPHLWQPDRGFFQFPAPVTVLAATNGGVYVAADKTYFLSRLDTEEPQQRTVLEFGAVEGTGVKLNDTSVSWFTVYGQANGGPDGNVSLPNSGVFAPSTTSLGAAGLLDHNGVQSVVTTMHGQERANRMAAGDYYRARILDET